MREVRASNDDGGNAPLVEEIPFCVKVSLVNACFDVGIFEQLPERVGIVVAENARRKAVIGLLFGSDEACFETLSESGLRFFRKLDNVVFNALIHGCLDGVDCVFEDNHTRENAHVARFGGFRQYGIVDRRWV